MSRVTANVPSIHCNHTGMINNLLPSRLESGSWHLRQMLGLGCAWRRALAGTTLCWPVPPGLGGDTEPDACDAPPKTVRFQGVALGKSDFEKPSTVCQAQPTQLSAATGSQRMLTSSERGDCKVKLKTTSAEIGLVCQGKASFAVIE